MGFNSGFKGLILSVSILPDAVDLHAFSTPPFKLLAVTSVMCHVVVPKPK